jgi:galactose mutarotase-like enzyme
MLSQMDSVSSDRYAVLETKDLVETHRLLDRDRDAEVVVSPVRGGMVTRYRIGADDILFLDQATLRDHTQNVRGGIPILFPIAGRLNGDGFMLDGERIFVPQHGFARKVPWGITASDNKGAASITVSLHDTESSRADWPFPFRLTFRYELRDGVLTIHQRYENPGNRPMPIHPGLHPYFRVEDWRKREARVPTGATQGFDNRTGVDVAVVGPIEFGPAEIDLQLLNHGQPAIRLTRPDLSAIELTYGTPDSVITIWAVPARDYVCVEPWSRRSDALNRGTALVVPAGGVHETMLRIARIDAPQTP